MRISRNGARIEPPIPESSQQAQPSAQQTVSQPTPQNVSASESAPTRKKESLASRQDREAARWREFTEQIQRVEPQAPVELEENVADDDVAYTEGDDGEYVEEYAYEEENPPRRRFPIGLVIFVLLLALTGFGAYKIMGFYQELDGLSELGPEQEIVIDQGSSVAAIAAQLKDEGLIEYDWLFKVYAKYSGKASGVQYGTFSLRSGMSYNEIIKALSVVQRRPTTMLTFPEGSTAVAVAQIMEGAGLCSVDEFLACANGQDGSDFSQYAFWNQIPDNGRIMKCEGYLLPETYEFYLDDSVYNYVDTFYREFDRKTAGLMDTINAKGTTLDDVIILASFIQEEAGLEAEDARVSACFHNRLESDDPLWADHRLQSNACS
ncbi:MAG: endolytic transglycosylase MltG, partial [Gemmiger sp.]